MGIKRRLSLRTEARKESGFTLVELMLALLLTGITLAVIYKTFTIQRTIYLSQDMVIEVQQNLRAVLGIMVRKIRMVGYDPQKTGQFGFKNLPGIGAPDYGRVTSSSGICFYVDINGNGTVDSDPDEQVAFRLNVAQDGTSLDGSPGREPDYVLRRYSTGTVKWQPMAENIEALNFVYLDEEGKPIPEDSLASRLADIRSVQIAIVGRTKRQEKNYKNYTIFRNLQNQIIFSAPGDGYRRRMVTATVRCRNLGIGS